MKYFDLSNDSITNFPDLSGYIIKTLYLSFNRLDTLKVNHLPRKVGKPNISHNKLKRMIWIYKNSAPHLRELNISFNCIEGISVSESLYRIIISHNDLTYITLNHEHIKYLDISFNPKFSNNVAFHPSQIDTIIREGIANDKPLYNFHEDTAGVVISCEGSKSINPISTRYGTNITNIGIK